MFKSVILQRMRDYNLIELFTFITEDLEIYFKENCLPLHLEEHKILIWLLATSKNVFSQNKNF